MGDNNNSSSGSTQQGERKAILDTWKQFLPSCSETGGLSQEIQNRILDSIKQKVESTPLSISKFHEDKWEKFLEEIGISSLQDQAKVLEGLRKLKVGIVENSLRIVDEFKLDEIPGDIADDMYYKDDCWVIRPAQPPGVLTPSEIIPYVGVSFVHHSVISWVDRLYQPGLQAKQIFIVDGNVKSGKTVTSRYVVPLLLTKQPLFKDARAVYVELLELAEVSTLAGKESGFCRLVAKAFQHKGVTGITATNIDDLYSALRRLANVYILTIDEYHFLYCKLSSDDCSTLGTKLKTLMLEASNTHFIVTASTQPLLWVSLDKSRPNGMSLLSNPVVFTTLRFSPHNWVRDTVIIYNRLAFMSHQISDKMLANNCATQVQILMEMSGHNLTAETARDMVAVKKQNTYHRDLVAFYSESKTVMEVLLQLATGAPNLPHVAMNPKVTSWIIKNEADRKYYLVDTELAVAVQSYATGGIHPALADRTLLYDLIPLGSAIDAGSAIQMPPVAAPSATAWQYVREHVQNAECGTPAKNWTNFFRLARNIYCHDTVTANYTAELAKHVVGSFGSRRDVREVFHTLLLPLGFGE